MIASTFLLASWLGCIIIAAFGMMMGRRSWIIVGNIVQIIGTIISATSFSYGQLIAGRVFIVSLRGWGNPTFPPKIPKANVEEGHWKRILDVYDPNLRCRNGCQDKQARTRCKRHDCGSKRRYCSGILGVRLFDCQCIIFSVTYSSPGTSAWSSPSHKLFGDSRLPSRSSGRFAP